MSVYFGPKARFNHKNWNYFKTIKNEKYFNITTNSIERLNRSLKTCIPNGFLKWNKLCKVLRTFHLGMMDRVYFEQVQCDKLNLQRPETRKRMTEYRKIILEFDQMNPSQRMVQCVPFAYRLGTISNPTLIEKFLQEPPVKHDDEDINPNRNLLDFSEIFDTTVTPNTACNDRTCHIPSFIDIPDDIPDLENC